MENSITVFSYAKINLSLDAGPPREDGLHPVDMVLQQVTLHDDVTIAVRTAPRGPAEGPGASGPGIEGPGTGRPGAGEPGAGSPAAERPHISLRVNRPYLPTDSRNLAWRAALLMAENCRLKGETVTDIDMEIYKRIPVSAGLAGGSSNAAAVMHGINTMVRPGFSLAELCGLGSSLGSDVPFCLTAQAAAEHRLPRNIRRDPMASSCARARGTGTELTPLTPLRAWVVIAKPHISVPTGEVYRGIDSCRIADRPDNDALAAALASGDRAAMRGEMINVLENYTLNAKEEAARLKEVMQELCRDAIKVLMSGSGPSVYALFEDGGRAGEACAFLRAMHYESYRCRTTG